MTSVWRWWEVYSDTGAVTKPLSIKNHTIEVLRVFWSVGWDGGMDIIKEKYFWQIGGFWDVDINTKIG